MFGRGVFLFLVLVLVLTSSSSYISLHQATKSNKDENQQKMTIALVNEDQGTVFNGEKYEFGKDFIQGIEKDPSHEWYVVSRGVAESGLKRDAYNMVIVIPNDFTQKALSMDSKVPEKARITYKINTSGNEIIKAKAEETASTILGDFNQRIIDVYFASVLGNLHEAQDNISDLVRKEKTYTSHYKNTIYQPLAGYTSQFNEMKGRTEVSRQSFEGLDSILQGFGSTLDERVHASTSFYTHFNDFIKLNNKNSLFTKGFAGSLSQFDKAINHTEVGQQLEQLERANEIIRTQFENNSGNTNNILTVSAKVKSYLESATNQIHSMDEEIADRIVEERRQVIEEKVRRELDTSSGEQGADYFKNIFSQMDKSAKQSLQKQMDKLPTLNIADIEELELYDETKTALKNVVLVTNKYKHEFGYTPNVTGSSTPLSEQIKSIKNNLVHQGVSISDSFTLSENQQAGQEISITIPTEYRVSQVFIELPERGEINYTETYVRNGKISLPQMNKGKIGLKINLVLKDVNSKIDVFQPVTWGWKLSQKAVSEVQTSNSETKNVESNHPLNSQESHSEEETTASNDNIEKAMDQNQMEQQQQGQTNTTVEKNTYERQVMSPLIGNSTSTLINSASSTVSEYQKLIALYKSYFGIDMNQKDLETVLMNSSLSDLATKESLFYLFQKQDIADFFTNFIVNQIIEEVQGQATKLKSDMRDYIQLVDKASESSRQLAEIITATTYQAEILNKSLFETLTNIKNWREESLELQEKHSIVLANEDEENSFFVTFDGELSSWLTTSQSLADLSKSNLETANGVYDTFKSIDQLASEIQTSGISIVKNANELSNNLSDKLMKDQQFADNFQSVLANSRIGERQNENLLSFLSNPVKTENAGMVIKGDTTIPYFLIVICFIVALFTAYTISSNEQRRPQRDSFKREQTLVGYNKPVAIITAGLGIVEGLVIGILSGYYLKINEERLMLWLGLMILIMLAMQLVATYLLRQLNMIGMFVLLLILSLYLFLAEAIGAYFEKHSIGSILMNLSPLEYLEKVLSAFSNGDDLSLIILMCLIAVIVISFIGQLFVLNRFSRGEVVEAEVETEGISEAN